MLEVNASKLQKMGVGCALTESNTSGDPQKQEASKYSLKPAQIKVEQQNVTLANTNYLIRISKRDRCSRNGCNVAS